MPLNDVGDRAKLRDPDQLVNPDPGLPVRPDLAEGDVEYVTLTNYSKSRQRVDMVVFPGMEVRVPRGTEYALLAAGFREDREREPYPEGEDADLSGAQAPVPTTTEAERKARTEAAQRRGERRKGKLPPHNPATEHLQAAEDAMAEGAVPGETEDVEGASEASARPAAAKPAKAGGEATGTGVPKP